MKKTSNNIQKKAFTLVETLLYISLTSLILISISAFLGTLMSIRGRNQSISEVDQQATQILQFLSRTIQTAESINAPSQGVTLDSLSLQTSNPALNPTIISLSGSTLQLQEGGNTPIVLSSNLVNISNVSFTNVMVHTDTPSIRFSFTISFNNPDGRKELDISKTYYGTATIR